jgi:hypothetical protein
MPEQPADSGTLSTAMSKDGNSAITPESVGEARPAKDEGKKPVKAVPGRKADADGEKLKGGA